MSFQKFSREYLTNLPIEMRKQFVQQNCQQKVNYVLAEARSGKTSCLVSIVEKSNMIGGHCNGLPWTATPPSKEEMAEFLQESFPDCKISYEEMWVETSPGKKELKKGLLVDWS